MLPKFTIVVFDANSFVCLFLNLYAKPHKLTSKADFIWNFDIARLT